MTRSIFIAGIFLFAFSSLANLTYGQFNSASGARASAMANSGILLQDEYGLFNNPGSLYIENLSFLSSYNTRYISLGINDLQIGLALPIGSFNTGVGVSYYGDNLFNELRVVTTGVHKVGFANLGMRIGYQQFYLENYGFKRTAMVDMGGVFSLSEELKLAMLITNLTRSKLEGQDNYRLSSLLAIGISYQPISAFRIDIQMNKDINLPISGSLGMEYMVNQHVSARTGFDFTNSIAALGLGLKWQRFKLDMAGQYQAHLGYSGVISILVSKKDVD